MSIFHEERSASVQNSNDRNQAMSNALKLAPLLTPDLAGELLREMSFLEENGCYSSFALIEGFTRVDSFDLELSLRTALLGCMANTAGEVIRITAYRHGITGMLIAWYWDGDGSLAFKIDDFLISNSDCKQDYNWERHENDGWVARFTRYDEPKLARPLQIMPLV